ncbi:MAG: YjbQ family protein [Proteobacteria bacterium]|nr:YjbQ family protein [Pseudomonadota bacterium]MCH8322333.1 YjbQ family protein [Pseudomonadota bacterium]
MTQLFQETLVITGKGPGLHDITGEVAGWLHGLSVDAGLLTLFIAHTSASLTIQENADADVCRDLEDFFDNLVKRDPSLYRHGAEGLDDMPAHIRSALTSTSLSIPVKGGKPMLGVWQGIYLFEHRDRPQPRKIHLSFQGN